MKRLVLFDIDGTLLRGGKLWSESFLRAVEHCAPGTRLPHVPSFAGKTDPQIFREIMSGAGLGAGEVDALIPRLQETYLAFAREELKTRAHEVKLLPGAREIVEAAVRHGDIVAGLLTGNLEAGARLKLGAAGLSHDDFAVGVFADDHWDRHALPAIGVARAKEKLGREFRGKEVVIIGDTVHDVRCGRSIGVRTIAVGTGWNIPRETLLAENPDYFFADLSETEAVLEAILDEL